MIVRTYGRRRSSNSLTRSYSDSDSPSTTFNDVVSDSGFDNSLSLSQPQEDIYGFHFSSQDSTAHWSFDSDPYNFNSSQDSRQLAILPPRKHPLLDDGSDIRKPKKARHAKKKVKSVESTRKKVTETATLMETQEVGEMMEHVDEVNFALDGLRKGQPVRIRRASLLSLLTICGTLQQRRLLRTHGTAKTIINAVMGLSFDDPASNLAAAALFYILTSDGQEDHLLDSPSSIGFLLKLLKPLTADAAKDKVATLGSKLVALRKDAAIFQDSKGEDSTSRAILVKVQEILVNCKDMKPRDGTNDVTEKPELCPKWIALLTMEKACLSTISLEETSGTVRKSGSNFKEKLREHGGLDAVFEVVRNCHGIMEGWLEQHSSTILESQKNVNLESLVVLLKCLKIMENATFLSNENQSHLLGIEGDFNYQRAHQSFTKLILNVIKILSGVSLQVNSPGSSANEKCCNVSNGTVNVSEIPSVLDNKVDIIDISSISSSIECCSIESSQKRQLSNDQLGFLKSRSESTDVSVVDANLLKMRVTSSMSGSCSGISSSSNNGAHVRTNNSWIKLGLGKKSEVSEGTKFDLAEDSQDPFAFDEDEFEPSKWDLLAGKQNVSQAQKGRAAVREHEGGSQSLIVSSQQESCNIERHHSPDASCSSAVDQEKSNLLADCLLTAVKVLMNLTNDNPIGCQQIAGCGGLETLSSLIARHFPSFSSRLPTFSELRDKSVIEIEDENDRHLTDQELDFLVAILGLLVNLVEKDGRNRSRLASTSVSLPSSEGLEDENRDVIALLCAIFLANQGAGEAAGEGKQSTWDEEDPILQGEKEAEKMIVEAYSALLLAFLSTESKSIRNAIAECLPDHKLAILVPVLERFLEFHLTLNMISPETHTTVLEVIESCRMP